MTERDGLKARERERGRKREWKKEGKRERERIREFTYEESFTSISRFIKICDHRGNQRVLSKRIGICVKRVIL